MVLSVLPPFLLSQFARKSTEVDGRATGYKGLGSSLVWADIAVVDVYIFIVLQSEPEIPYIVA